MNFNQNYIVMESKLHRDVKKVVKNFVESGKIAFLDNRQLDIITKGADCSYDLKEVYEEYACIVDENKNNKIFYVDPRILNDERRRFIPDITIIDIDDNHIWIEIVNTNYPSDYKIEFCTKHNIVLYIIECKHVLLGTWNDLNSIHDNMKRLNFLDDLYELI